MMSNVYPEKCNYYEDYSIKFLEKSLVKNIVMGFILARQAQVFKEARMEVF